MGFVGFDQPYYLLLLLLLPVLWVLSYRSLSGLGRTRRIFTLLLRTCVLACLVLALSGVQYRKTGNRLTVIFLLDQSESIPQAKRDLMLSYVVKEVSVHRKRESDDRAGVIVFGREATVEIPPFNDDLPDVGRLESLFAIRTDATNLEGAMKLAHASFPEDSAKRIVVVTDGNENVGNARALGRVLVDDQISIDVVPVALTARAEIAVEKVTMPAELRRGQPVEARVVVSNYSNAGTAPDGTPLGRTVKAKITVTRKGHNDTLLTEQVVDLPPGKQIFRIPHKIDQPDLYSYIATVTPVDTQDDLMSQNNQATAFTHVRGKGRILFIVDWKNPLDYEFLINRLKSMDLEVQVQRTDALFTSLAELQAYDTVIMADVPRSSSGDTSDGVTSTPQSFSDEQVKMLVRNLEMGSGLIMLGGPNSFGVGGWTNTELEKAMPVDFQVKNKKIQAVGALVLMMHASEMAQGNYWQAVVAREAIRALGPMDYCGLIHWDNRVGDDWLWGRSSGGLLRVSTYRKRMLSRLSSMTPGDMPQFDPAMKMAAASLTQVKASVKHMIIISDGDPSPPMNSTIQSFVKAGVKISTVAVGTHGPAGSTRLQGIAAQTKGKYYVVRNPQALPKIYQREARRVARPLIFEPERAVVPIALKHEALQDINVQLPPIKGFVLTTKKDSALVDVAMRSPLPQDAENATLLASWNYGLGRAVVFTSDVGKTKPRWSTDWNNWENFDKVFGQLVRWSMRPHDEKGKFHVASTIKEGKIRVVVTALDKNDDFLNMLDMTGVATSPDLKSKELSIRQTAPGRYVGEMPVDKAGSYFITINPGEGKPPILTGVNVPYSSEYRDREANMALVTELASYKPKGGEKGTLVDGDLTHDGVGQLVQANDTFRHDLPRAIAIHDVWPWFLLIGAVLFFGDVFIRRVTVGFEWFFVSQRWVRNRLFGRAEEDDSQATKLERLRSRKAAIAEQIDERRTATRFEPEVEEDGPAPDLNDVISETANTAAPPRPTSTATQITPEDEEADSYTSRLLAAKKKAFKDQNNG